MNPTYRMWITDASGRRISASGVRLTHEEMLELLPLEKDRQRAYALVPNVAHMVDSDGDHWRRIN